MAHKSELLPKSDEIKNSEQVAEETQLLDFNDPESYDHMKQELHETDLDLLKFMFDPKNLRHPIKKNPPTMAILIYKNMARIIYTHATALFSLAPVDVKKYVLFPLGTQPDGNFAHTPEEVASRLSNIGSIWVPLNKLSMFISEDNDVSVVYIRHELVEAILLAGKQVVGTLKRQPEGVYPLYIPGLDKIVKTWLPPILYMETSHGLTCGFDLSDEPQENPFKLYNFPFNCAGEGEMCMGSVKYKRLNIPLHLYASKANFDYPTRLKVDVTKWLETLKRKDLKALREQMVPFTWDIRKSVK